MGVPNIIYCAPKDENACANDVCSGGDDDFVGNQTHPLNHAPVSTIFPNGTRDHCNVFKSITHMHSEFDSELNLVPDNIRCEPTMSPEGKRKGGIGRPVMSRVSSEERSWMVKSVSGRGESVCIMRAGSLNCMHEGLISEKIL